jgi:tripartite-type tricarboxylate transporter receptor subunit TctC
VEDGKVRALAVTSAERMERWKDVPTMVEQGYPGFLYDAFVALAGPPNMPPSIVDKLNKALNEVLQTPAFREQLDSLGMVPPKSDNSPKGLSEFLIRETDHQAELAKLSGRTLVK